MVYLEVKIENAIVHGSLAIGTNNQLLSEDMVDVELPNGILISTGWYPEGDINGSYKISVTKGFNLLEERHSCDPLITLEIIQEFAEKYKDIDSYHKYIIRSTGKKIIEARRAWEEFLKEEETYPTDPVYTFIQGYLMGKEPK